MDIQPPPCLRPTLVLPYVVIDFFPGLPVFSRMTLKTREGLGTRLPQFVFSYKKQDGQNQPHKCVNKLSLLIYTIYFNITHLQEDAIETSYVYVIRPLTNWVRDFCLQINFTVELIETKHQKHQDTNYFCNTHHFIIFLLYTFTQCINHFGVCSKLCITVVHCAWFIKKFSQHLVKYIVCNL